MADHRGPGRLPAHFTTPGSSSFIDFLGAAAPDLLPGRRPLPPGIASELAPHGTTIIALTFDRGVLMAGDRRATAGNVIAQRDAEKVAVADSYSAIGIAGTAGIAHEMTKLFQVELEHYEKIEGTPLTLEGKANRLSTMVRGNLGAAMQGLVVVPIFAGLDLDVDDAARAGRIFTYDPTGGSYEERWFHGVGSGSIFARNALKKRWRAGLERDDAIRVALEALYDAADDDTATGGPDITRDLYPTMVVVTPDGAVMVRDDDLAVVAQRVIAGRRDNPGG
ncbi:MAG: proteasome subunit beta [Mycobacteriales bacterium]|nr:MAG: proteasome subunit beta [Pseudonocardiales bacterium]